jgi:hypothetical protein
LKSIINMSVSPIIEFSEDINENLSPGIENNRESSIEQLFCRICMESTIDGLIKPCLCRGTSAYVHESCLKTWIFTKSSEAKNSSCEICKEYFKVSIFSRFSCKANSDSEKRFRFYVKMII